MNITQPQQQLKRAGSRNVPTERKPRDLVPFSTNQMSPWDNGIRIFKRFIPTGKWHQNIQIFCSGRNISLVEIWLIYR